MSLVYDGTTSILTSDATQTIGTLFSGSAWIKTTSQGESDEGIVMALGPNGTERIKLAWDTVGGSKKLSVSSVWTGTFGKWDMTTGFASIAPWLWVGFTYDGGATTNDPILYTLVGSTFSILTVGSGLTESSTPVGSLPADNQLFRFGNSSTAARTFDGLIGEGAFWKRLLTDPSMAAVAFNGVNSNPDHFNYLPQDGGSTQNLGSSGTTFTPTATTTGENPPIRPAGRRG